MRTKLLLLCCLLPVASAPLAARTPAARALDQAINTLAVDGSIEIDADGKVQRYAIEHPEAYSAAVRDMLDRVVPQWTFRPVQVDGVARAARSSMHLRLRADPIGDGQFRVVVAGASFDGAAAPGTEVALDLRAPMPPPKIPKAEWSANIGAQVLVVLRIGRNGRVEDAIAEQTNLDQLATPKAMARWRRDFEAAAVGGLKHWTFVTPTQGPDADAPYWSVRIPVVFTPIGSAAPAHAPGKWESYVPGPHHPVPWATDEEQALAAGALDALPGSGVFPLKPALQLLTPLNAG